MYACACVCACLCVVVFVACFPAYCSIANVSTCNGLQGRPASDGGRRGCLCGIPLKPRTQIFAMRAMRSGLAPSLANVLFVPKKYCCGSCVRKIVHYTRVQISRCWLLFFEGSQSSCRRPVGLEHTKHNANNTMHAARIGKAESRVMLSEFNVTCLQQLAELVSQRQLSENCSACVCNKLRAVATRLRWERTLPHPGLKNTKKAKRNINQSRCLRRRQ